MARVAYLQRYINSHGVELPPDFIEFSEGHLWEKKCVFCQKPHDIFPVYKYYPVFKVRTVTEVYACTACDRLITSAMVKPEYPEIFEEFYKTKQKDHDHDEKDYGNRQFRINLYNVNEDFDQTVHNYFIRPHQTEFKCYFCGEFTEADSREIGVPVSPEHMLTGGFVKICDDCFSEVWDKEGESIHREEKCAYCVRKYLVTIEEHSQRRLNGTIGKHMCPICTEEGITEEQRINSVLADGINHKKPYHRFLYNLCTICGDTVKLDLTILHSRLKKTHTSNESKLRCQICYIFKVTTTNEKIIVNIKDLYCVIFYLDKQWSYRISKIVNNEESVNFRPASTYKVSNPLTAIDDAIRGVYNLYEPPELDL
jgi:DNA-directed RNA polymerase subunit RPC12/RpoP